ncbi:MAG: hypothetical protein ABI548_01775 [Polyangiaceae bacterium]
MIASHSGYHQSGVIDQHSVKWAMGACLGLSLWGRPAPAAAGEVPLAYSAPDGCASQAEFRTAVQERGGRFDTPGAAGSAQAVRIAIRQEGDSFRGMFQATTGNAASAPREVHGPNCQDVSDALVVVTALALRGEAAREPPASTTPAEPALPAVTAAAPLRATRSLGSARMAVPAGTVSFDKARAVTLFAGGELGLLSHTLVPRYDLSFDAANFVTLPGGRSFLDGSIARVRLSYLGPTTYRANDAAATLQGVSFGMALCLSPLYDTAGLVALFCVEYGAGVIQVKAQDAPGGQTRSKATGFGTAGVGFEARYNLGSVFDASLKLGADGSINAIGAQRADGTEIFHSSSLLGYGMLGIGMHF